MKLQVVYEPNDVIRAIRHDLARQGIPAEDVTVKFGKNGSAIVSMEVTPDDTPPPAELSSGMATVPVAAMPPSVSFATAPPKLETIEGGANPVDMTEVLRASGKVAAAKPGIFPTPQHKMLDGESTEFPGGDS